MAHVRVLGMLCFLFRKISPFLGMRMSPPHPPTPRHPPPHPPPPVPPAGKFWDDVPPRPSCRRLRAPHRPGPEGHGSWVFGYREGPKFIGHLGSWWLGFVVWGVELLAFELLALVEGKWETPP